MANLVIQYNLEKDTENFIRGLESVNNPKPTKLHQEFFDKCGEVVDPDKVRSFLENKIQNEVINIDQVKKEVASKWSIMENEFFKGCEKIFKLELPTPVIGYLSFNQRCTYKWQENYFFIYLDSKDSNGIIMHELLHFYTHRKFDGAVSNKQKFNDIKESLTVLLNTEFSDLMGGVEDAGYPQHQEMRERIVHMRKEGLSIEEIFDSLIS